MVKIYRTPSPQSKILATPMVWKVANIHTGTKLYSTYCVSSWADSDNLTNKQLKCLWCHWWVGSLPFVDVLGELACSLLGKLACMAFWGSISFWASMQFTVTWENADIAALKVADFQARWRPLLVQWNTVGGPRQWCSVRWCQQQCGHTQCWWLRRVWW